VRKRARSGLLFVLFVMPAVGLLPAFAGGASARTFPPPPPVNENAPAHVQTACAAILANNPNTSPPGFNNGYAEDIFQQLGYTMGCFE